MEQAYRRVLLVESKQLFWERVLSNAERERLGHPDAAFKKFGGVVGVWRELYGGSQPRAIIDAAVRLKHLDPEDRNWLLEAVGESPDQPPVSQSSRPNWDRGTRRLTYKGKLVRPRVRITRVSKIDRILDAFQAMEWPESITSPLTGGQQEAHESVRSLNDGLKKIRFHVSDSGETIYWELR
ncbi:MAG: hypothetical protein JNK76_08480 [Planctomycetales bacterium]|nr:hypothetical protein [Planctomycetales bacterium]